MIVRSFSKYKEKNNTHLVASSTRPANISQSPKGGPTNMLFFVFSPVCIGDQNNHHNLCIPARNYVLLLCWFFIVVGQKSSLILVVVLYGSLNGAFFLIFAFCVLVLYHDTFFSRKKSGKCTTFSII